MMIKIDSLGESLRGLPIGEMNNPRVLLQRNGNYLAYAVWYMESWHVLLFHDGRIQLTAAHRRARSKWRKSTLHPATRIRYMVQCTQIMRRSRLLNGCELGAAVTKQINTAVVAMRHIIFGAIFDGTMDTSATNNKSAMGKHNLAT